MKTVSAYNSRTIDRQVIEPITLLEIELDGLTLYFSDRSWFKGYYWNIFEGQLYEPFIFSYGEIKVSEADPIWLNDSPGEFEIKIFNNVAVGNEANFSSLLLSYAFQFSTVTLKRVFINDYYADNPDSGDVFILFKGKIEEVPEINRHYVSLICSSFKLSLLNKFSHTIIDNTTYPYAKKEDFGKMLPIVYGSCRKVPFALVRSPGKTTLTAAMNSTATVANVTDTSGFGSSGYLVIGEERIAFAGKTSSSFTGLTRHQGGTSAENHLISDVVTEYGVNSVYLLNHPVKAINVVYGDSVKLIDYTAYTGQSGDELTGYEGKAAILFTSPPYFLKSGTVSVNDGITVSDNISVTTTLNKQFNNIHSNLGVVERLHTFSLESISISLDSTSDWSPTPAWANSKNGWEIEVTLNLDIVEFTGIHRDFYLYAVLGGHYYDFYTIIDGVVTLSRLNMRIVGTGNYPANYTDLLVVGNANYAVDLDIYFSVSSIRMTMFKYNETAVKSGNAYRSGAVTATGGNSNRVLVDLISADVDGYQDDGSGTYTGTANALIERPDHIFKHLLMALCGLSSSEINATSYAAAGALFSSNSIDLAICLLERPNILSLLTSIAIQSKCIEFWEEGEHNLKFIESSPSVDMTVYQNTVDAGSVKLFFTQRVDIVNKLSARFDVVWENTDEEERSEGLEVVEDSESQSTFGVLEGDVVSLDFVTNSAHAILILNWLIDKMSEPILIVEFEGDQRYLALELGDVIKFSFDKYEFLIT